MQRNGFLMIALIIGLAAGIGAGLLYAWVINPRIEVDTAPWQLNATFRTNYLIAISLAYAEDRDLLRAGDRLASLRLGGDTWQVMADGACELARTNYASTSPGLAAIRSMVNLAASQGATACASTLLPLYTSTPAPTFTPARPTLTLAPPPSKTPTATLGVTFTPDVLISPTARPAGSFEIIRVDPFCNPKTPGIIEIQVQDVDGTTGIPAVQIEISSTTDKETFYTGLKPERGDGYADYKMTPGEKYTLTLQPGLSERTQPLEARACSVQGSATKSVTSYRVFF